MDKEQIASLGCKLLGIYALIQSIPLIGNVFQIFAFAKGDPSFSVSLFLSAFLPFVIMASLGTALLTFSGKFAKKMIPLNVNNDSEKCLSAKDIQSIAFSVVGLIMIVLAIPKIFQIGWNVHALKIAGDQRNTLEIVQKNWSFALATGVQFMIGFLLFIGSELISTMWHLIIKRLKFEKNITK